MKSVKLKNELEHFLELRLRLERFEKWREIGEQMPAIPMKAGWLVTVLPPYGGAAARFLVQKKQDGPIVSVYFDAYERLGFFGSEAYFEIYPNVHGTEDRFGVNEIYEMVEAIDASLNLSNASGEQSK